MIKVWLLQYEAQADRRADHARQRELGDRLLAHVLMKEKGIELKAGDILRAEKGKPYLRSGALYFSKSHSRAIVAVAIGEAELGVDCQAFRPVTEALIRRTCSETEADELMASKDRDRDFALLWAKKEAFVKMKGTGLTVPMKDIPACEVKNVYLAADFAAAVISENAGEAEFILINESDI